jgi:UDP:flavonoid glycosyltransferase YjiC (YdhE family)
LPILFQQDYLAYHVPPRSPFEYLISEAQWNEFLENTLDDIIRIHRPAAVVFDGTYPYDGLRHALDARREIKRIWIKRGLYRTAGFSETVRDYIDTFDRVILPGELSDMAKPSSDGKTSRVPPIVYEPRESRVTRAGACTMLRLDPHKPIAYIQLGAGNINDIREQTQVVIDVLNRRFPDLQLVLGESPIARTRARFQGRYALLRDYPNSIYFDAFDIAILAAGYNSVYETMFFGLPAIFVPRTVGTDDQLARARLAERMSGARLMESFDTESLCRLVQTMLGQARGSSSAKAFGNGARPAAHHILETAGLGASLS